MIIQRKYNMEEITDRKVSVLDQKVYDAINQAIVEHHISSWDAKSLVLPMIKNHRMLLNTEDGYWILGFDIKAVNKLKRRVSNCFTKILEI